MAGQHPSLPDHLLEHYGPPKLALSNNNCGLEYICSCTHFWVKRVANSKNARLMIFQSTALSKYIPDLPALTDTFMQGPHIKLE